MQRQDGEWLDRMYNNRALVPQHGAHFARWADASRRAREAFECVPDIPYGDSAGQRLDVFPAPQARGPVMVFLHGGYWRALDKSDHSFVAPMFQDVGACVVVPNYDLCPAVTIPQITLQIVRALAWTWKHAPTYGGDPRQVTVVGHSAGGQLAAMLLACDWRAWDPELPADAVRKALSISGLFDLEPIRRTPFLQDLRLTPEDARRASPAFLPAPAGAALYAVAGGDESPEFLRQNRLIREAWGEGCVEVCEALPGLNHFSVLEALVEPEHRLHELALDLLFR
ncbi:alpha/beta hydrolase [Ramlibacter tataouinensis]|uniref:alpha/beta hydrolase n=1 Tax=Ramlibacter tataouinensis TaxID=94132 RepID=UPI0022F404CA|nr:alpha/beta hydrolase [Ramlibacter tataouinensis]WBY02749.1 alpha/beta hydrolase [Ramlibacter tataouinensis]